MTEVKKEKDILDQVKTVEKFKKIQVLAESIEKIKGYAKEVLILKEKTNMLLEEIGISEADAKKVIDYVNSLVKLTKKDKEELRESVQDDKEETEKKITKKMEETPYPVSAFTTYASTSSSTGPSSSNPDWTIANYKVSLGNTGTTIKI